MIYYFCHVDGKPPSGCTYKRSPIKHINEGILQHNGWIQEILPLNCTLRKASCILFLGLLLSEKTELNCLITRFTTCAMYISYRK